MKRAVFNFFPFIYFIFKKIQELPKKASVTEVKSNGGAFQPFQREKNVGKPNGSSSSACTTPVASAPATSSNAAGGSNKREEDKDGQNQRKQRRNWSPELHKRFLSALQQLGGSHGTFLSISIFHNIYIYIFTLHLN